MLNKNIPLLAEAYAQRGHGVRRAHGVLYSPFTTNSRLPSGKSASAEAGRGGPAIHGEHRFKTKGHDMVGTHTRRWKKT